MRLCRAQVGTGNDLFLVWLRAACVASMGQVRPWQGSLISGISAGEELCCWFSSAWAQPGLRHVAACVVACWYRCEVAALCGSLAWVKCAHLALRDVDGL